MLRTAILLTALLAGTLSANADRMTFYLKNQTPRGVVVELSNPQTGQRWPGDDQVYALDGKENKSVRIDCQAGERICYGAWVNGNDRVFWGVGPDNDQPCETCCRTCASEATETVVIGE